MDTSERDLLTTLDARLDPAHTALLVIDMQNDFCAEGGFVHRRSGTDMSPNIALADRITALVETARGFGVPVIWIVACYDPDLVPEAHLARQRASGVEGVCCASGSWGEKLFRVTPAPGEPLVTKTCYDGFFRTGLDEMLKAQGIRCVVATGVATHVCVDSTVRGALFHGYYAVVPEDCVGGWPVAQHDAALACLGGLFADVTDAATVAEAWDRATG
jgi:ureidoacrylate peracid hydrolase